MSAVSLPKAFLFGDSLTQMSFRVDSRGWGAQLAELLERRVDVVNRGFSGYNSRWGREILPRLLTRELAAEVVLLTVWFGVNDCAQLAENGVQHVPIAEYRENLAAIVRHATSVGVPAARILLFTPPPIADALWDVHYREKYGGARGDRTFADAAAYAAACRQVASELGVDVVDVFAGLQAHPAWGTSELQRDGLHLGAAGGDAVWALVRPHVEARLGAAGALCFPYWADSVTAERLRSWEWPTSLM